MLASLAGKENMMNRTYCEHEEKAKDGETLPYQFPVKKALQNLATTYGHRRISLTESRYTSPPRMRSELPRRKPIATIERVKKKPPRVRRRKKGSSNRKKKGPEQNNCCIIGCHNGVTNRLRFSLRCFQVNDFKIEFLDCGWDKVCHYHYFADLYKYKKQLKLKEKKVPSATRPRPQKRLKRKRTPPHDPEEFGSGRRTPKMRKLVR